MEKKRIIIIDNTLDASQWEQYEVEDVCAFLKEYYKEWPATAHIYHNQVAVRNDVTPHDDAAIEKLQSLEGNFYCVVYPEGGAAIVIGVIAIVAAIAVVFLSNSAVVAPPSAIATSVATNRQTRSANNELSDRKNTERVNGRIPDIYGTVRSTPDLIAVPYQVYKNHKQVEYAYMCVGRGYYDVSDIRDDDTLISDIAGTSVEVYAPYTSPNSGDAPQLRIGTAINTPLYDIYRSNSVNGQTLRAPNDANVTGDSNIAFHYPNEILNNTTSIDFTDYFEPDDVLVVSNASTTITVGGVSVTRDFSGTYAVVAVSDEAVILSNPSAVNTAWADLVTSETTPYISPKLETIGDKWVGPFTLDYKNADKIFINVVADNGLYKDNGSTQTKTSVTVEAEYTQIDGDGNTVGTPQTKQITIDGSATTTRERAATLYITPTFTGPCIVRMRRVTGTDTSYNGTVVDEVKWRDLYSVRTITQEHFDDVTTVQTVTYATAGALLIKERKTNMLVTRKLPTRVSGSTFTETVSATNSADDIISAICLDTHIGNREKSEIDFDSIYNTVAEIKSYFGTARAAQFCYTFDDDNLTFEETISAIASTIFCSAYRQGNLIKLNFEKKTDDSVLLFNHRNKIPDSETRTVSFGYTNDNDGVEIEYVDPDDDTIETFYLPEDQSAINPKTLETVGIRSKVQAHFHAWRAWQKIQHQNTVVEFDGTQECDLLVLGDRILVADNTRADTQDGEIISQDGLILKTSQPVIFEEGKSYVIFLQLYDNTIESIGVTKGSDKYHVVLETAPRIELSTDAGNYARTTYVITEDSDTRVKAFLVTTKDPQDNMTTTVTASSYDSRFYAHDIDFITGAVTE